jgi:hypothetical protein
MCTYIYHSTYTSIFLSTYPLPLVPSPAPTADFATTDFVFPETDSEAIPRDSSAGLGGDAPLESSLSFSRCGTGDGQGEGEGEGLGLTGGRVGAPAAAMRARYCSPSRHMRFCTSLLCTQVYTYMDEFRDGGEGTHVVNQFTCIAAAGR